MRSSVFFATGAATLAMGNPVQPREVETTWVEDWQTVTVTANADSKPTIVFGEQTPEPTADSVVVVTVTPEPTPTSSPDPTLIVITETEGASKATAEASVDVPISTPLPTVGGGTQDEPEGDDVISQAIYHHNIHRFNHSASAVGWNDELADYASITAATCVFEHDMNQGGGGYGQNLANWGVSSGAEALGEVGAIKMAITDQWYNGEFNKFLPEFYGAGNPDMSDFEGWGHYTQLIWKGSKEIGCKAQFCPKGSLYDDFDAWYTVCNYRPAGNMDGSYATNVLPALGNAISIV